MPDAVVSTVNGIVETWKREAAQRKLRTPSDQVAEALESCASELEAEVKRVSRETTIVPVGQWAGERGVAMSSARRWCAAGQIPGAFQDTKNEWQVPRNARRVIQHRSRAS